MFKNSINIILMLPFNWSSKYKLSLTPNFFGRRLVQNPSFLLAVQLFIYYDQIKAYSIQNSEANLFLQCGKSIFVTKLAAFYNYFFCNSAWDKVQDLVVTLPNDTTQTIRISAEPQRRY